MYPSAHARLSSSRSRLLARSHRPGQAPPLPAPAWLSGTASPLLPAIAPPHLAANILEVSSGARSAPLAGGGLTVNSREVSPPAETEPGFPFGGRARRTRPWSVFGGSGPDRGEKFSCFFFWLLLPTLASGLGKAAEHPQSALQGFIASTKVPVPRPSSFTKASREPLAHRLRLAGCALRGVLRTSAPSR